MGNVMTPAGRKRTIPITAAKARDAVQRAIRRESTLNP